MEADDQAQRQLIIERVLKRVRLSKAKRILQTRLRLAGFKASHGWQDVSFEKIEPQLSQRLKTKQVQLSPSKVRLPATRAVARSERSPPSYHERDQSQSNLTTPDHQKHLPYHSESESGHTFSSGAMPQISTNSYNAPPRSQIQTPSNPHTPEQIVRSKWNVPRAPSQTYSNSTPEDDELRDQTTAAEMMLFLATGSPSPNHRSITSVTRNQCHHVQTPLRFRT